MDGSVESKVGIRINLSQESAHVAPETWKRARAMIEGLLQEAEAPDNEYVFAAKGLFREYESFPSPHLEITPGSQSDGLVVKLRARGGSDGTLWGHLRLPYGLNRERLLQEAKIAERRFNAEGWVDVINAIPPGPRPERVVSGHVAPAMPTPCDLTSLTNIPSGTVPAIPTAQVTQARSPDQDEKERCAYFLLRLLKDAENGLFLIKNTSPAAREIFPDRNPHGLVTGIFSKLTGFGWIRRVGKGQFQVEEVFAREHSLGFNLRPLPKLARNSNPSHSVSGKVKHTAAPDLAGQLEAMKNALLAEQERLEGVIALAENDLAKVRQGLERFNQQVQEALHPLVKKFLPR